MIDSAKPLPSRHEDEAWFRAELPGAEGEGVDETLGDRVARGRGCGGDEHRVDGAHLGEDRDSAAGAAFGERHASALAAGECDSAHDGRVDELETGVETHHDVEGAIGGAGVTKGMPHNVAESHAEPRVRGVRLHDDRAAGGEGGGDIVAEDAEAEREVARAEHRDHPDRDVPAREGRSATQVVAAHAKVAPLAGDGGVEPCARRHPGQLAPEPGDAEAGLGAGEVHELVGCGDGRVGRRGEPGLAGAGADRRELGSRPTRTLQHSGHLVRGGVPHLAGARSGCRVETRVRTRRVGRPGHAVAASCGVRDSSRTCWLIAAVSTRRPSSSSSVPMTSGGRSRMTFP